MVEDRPDPHGIRALAAKISKWESEYCRKMRERAAKQKAEEEARRIDWQTEGF